MNSKPFDPAVPQIWNNRQSAAAVFDDVKSFIENTKSKDKLNYLSNPASIILKTGDAPTIPNVVRYNMPLNMSGNPFKIWTEVEKLWDKYNDRLLIYNNACLSVEEDYRKVIAIYADRFALNSTIGQFINNTINNNTIIGGQDKLNIIINYIDDNYKPNTTRDQHNYKLLLFNLSDDNHSTFGDYHNQVIYYTDKLETLGYIPTIDEMQIFIFKSVTNPNLKFIRNKLLPDNGNLSWKDCLKEMSDYLSISKEEELTILRKAYLSNTTTNNNNYTSNNNNNNNNQNNSNKNNNNYYNNHNNHNNNNTVCSKCGVNGHTYSKCKSLSCLRCNETLQPNLYHHCTNYVSIPKNNNSGNNNNYRSNKNNKSLKIRQSHVSTTNAHAVALSNSSDPRSRKRKAASA
jgi:hypothetical protein